ncbi:MAG TPA: helix-turn-helix domain-containing protein, partial [Opitutaceae bacterium]|nr:helix-turn-helix domain-containing protein [Opitutaceae bacterium]
RRDEIPTLTDFFVARYSRKYNRPARPISDHLRQLFLQYDWPGNIRELENMIKRVVILQDEQLVVREIERNMQRAVAIAAAAPAVAGVAAAAMASGAPMYAYPVMPPPAAQAPPPADATDTEDAGESAPGDAPEASGGSLAAVAKAASLKAERAAIEQTLRQVHWNRRKAAQILGVSYKTLLNKIKECGITRA